MLLVGTVLATVTIAVTAWSAYDRNQQITEELRSHLDDLVRLQATAVGDAVWNLNRDTVQDILAGAKVNPDFHAARVVLRSGTTFAEITGAQLPPSRLLASRADVEIVEGTERRLLGHVEVTFSLVRLADQQARALWQAFAIGLIQLVAVLLGTGMILRRIIGPLESLREGIITLADGTTDIDIPSIGRSDQIGDMARAVKNFQESLIENERLHAEQAEKAIELEQARNSAEAANQAKSDFLSSMSHELRTPLNSILGFGQILETDTEPALTADQLDSLSRIMKGGQHLLELINDVLDFARIEAGKVVFSYEDVPARVILEDCLTLVEMMAAQRNITIVVGDSFLAAPDMRADYTRLKQSLLNLLSNAIKYNSVNGTVTVGCGEVPGGMVRISIKDSGKGVDKELIEELFEPFNRLDAEASDIEGAGIGLTITRQIIQNMGGRIGVESTRGVGSTFWIELPVAEKSRADIARENIRVLEDKNDRLREVSGTVLYVEDNPDNLKLMELIVSRTEGISLISAHNALLGIELAKTRAPDLIILDINLPGMDGFEALKELQGLTATRHIPVIALSANVLTREVKRGIDAGFLRYLTKPVQIAEVTEAIREIL
jgi:signal transduction histidine kinase